VVTTLFLVIIGRALPYTCTNSKRRRGITEMKFLRLLIIFSLITSMIMLYLPNKTKAAPSVSASAAVLMEQKSGRVLYEKNPHQVRRIASITKIMTAILAIESGKLDEMVKVSGNAIKAEGSSVYLKEGEKIKLEDLVYGLMLRSGNDAAVAIAEHVGGSLDGFVFLMNEKAQEIGMKNTNFANPHGLDDHENHHSTAYDMALLTRYAMNNDTYKKIAGTKVHRAPNPTESWDRVWKNKNRLLTELYEYTTGGKTGYTKRAKRTLVTTATKEDLNLIAVTLNGPDDWNDHINMYETAFRNFEMVDVLNKGILKEIDEPFYEKKAYIKRTITYPVTSGEEKLFKIDFKVTKPKQEWRDGENEPDIIGQAIVYFDHQQISKVPIYYKKSEVKEDKSFLEYFKNMFFSFSGVKKDG
jgi:serine-type D-Ala-D-Ala carboxypeptidase (penicillin-binding protein 5/6)